MNTTPRWQTERIEHNQRKAKPDTCPNCRQLVICGLDNDHGARPATCEPTPLTRDGELLANLELQRRTYAVIGGALHKRTPEHITAESRYPILTDHACHDPTPTGWHKPQPTPRPEEKDTDDDPPF